MKKRCEPSAYVGATEFKARCLELMQDVHDRKLSSITVTKRGKPFVRVVPAADDLPPLRGLFRGRLKIHGDLTEPIDVEWEALSD